MNLDESISYSKISKQYIEKSSESSEVYDPNNSMIENYNNPSKTIKQNKVNPDISMIFQKNYKDYSSKDEEEEVEEEKENITDYENYEEDNNDNFIINYDDIYHINISKINEYSKHNLNDSFDEKHYFFEMSENLSLIENEPFLIYDNDKSFTKEVDNLIRKLYTPITDSYLQILMIAEKPSIARKITRFLSNFNYKVYKHSKMYIFTFKGFFKGKPAHFTVTSVKGHIYDNKYIFKYEEEEPVKSYDYDTIKVLKNNEINIPKFLRYIAKDKDILCLWIDCDAEGENICYEIIHNVLPYMNQKHYQQVYRAIFSALTKRDIENAFYELRDYPNCELSMSVDARSIIDYKVGISFSKLLTSNILDFIEENENLEKDVLSYGPCQTPTLWFCVQRKKKIDEFIPSKLYNIYVRIKGDDDEFYKIYMNKQYQNKESAKYILEDLKKNFYLSVQWITERKLIENSPEGLNTTTMLKKASSQLKISPKEASYIAQDLYMKGYISYPRTSSTKYSPNFNIISHLKMFEKDYNSVFFGIVEEENGFKADKYVQELIKDFNIRNIDFF